SQGARGQCSRLASFPFAHPLPHVQHSPARALPHLYQLLPRVPPRVDARSAPAQHRFPRGRRDAGAAQAPRTAHRRASRGPGIAHSRGIENEDRADHHSAPALHRGSDVQPQGDAGRDQGGAHPGESGGVKETSKPGMSVSLAMDNLWSYQKTHGDAGWDAYPTYLDPLVEVVLERLRKHRMTITFFVVGQDAALEKNAGAFRSLGAEGHEIGSHSFRHEPWLHLYSRPELEEELASAEEHIERATGKRPIGFRGPGFSYSRETLDILSRRGYLYDASTFPTFIGALARAYYFWKSDNLTEEEKEKRKGLFGKFSDGFQPLKPYRWGGSGGILEIPVTTMPV